MMTEANETIAVAARRLADVDTAQLADVVDANHVLFNQGVVDGFGHVSARHDKHPDCFILACSMAPALVTAADIMAFDLDGDAMGGDARRPYLERFIHGEIYRLRPDVMSVVHSHSPAVIPFGVVPSVKLRCLCHMSGFLGQGVPVFEIRDVDGPATNLLISDRARGAALGRALGHETVVLMRGHGSTTVGRTVREAVFHAVYAEVNARLQSEAMRLGPVVFLTPEEAQAAAEANAGQMNRAWDMWRMRAHAAQPAQG